MNLSSLPVGKAPAALPLSYFPTRFQAVIFRNWELVAPERLARVLHASENQILAAADRLGLRTPPQVSPDFPVRGYVTLIRENWQLLPYEQLLEILGWTPEKLASVLQNDDFLWVKLGYLKPQCEIVHYRELTPEEATRTDAIAATLRTELGAIDALPGEEPPWGFLDNFDRDAARLSPAGRPRRSDFSLRMAYSYSALYGDALAAPELSPYPDALLRLLADRGINAIWLPALLYQLTPFADAPELSDGWEKRQAALRDLTCRAGKYGLQVFLYLNEPRGLPVETYRRHPELRELYLGEIHEHENETTMCTALPAVREYLENSVYALFHAVPLLAGAFTITYSENFTHCRSRDRGDSCRCPRCRDRAFDAIIAEVNTIIYRAACRANAGARILAWNWGPWHESWSNAVIDKLPDGIEVMCVSENGLGIQTGGVAVTVNDYSISHPGPSERTRKVWDYARTHGLKTVAKVQLSNSWEGSCVPYIPATRLVAQHLDRLRQCGVEALMVSWTLGGYPSINMDLLAMTHEEMVETRFGRRAAPRISEALTLFSKAFAEFPFDIGVVYTAPHNLGPANPLYDRPTGYEATMVGFPYDDLESWRGPYPAEIFEQQLQMLAEIWHQGLEVLAAATTQVEAPYRANYEDLCGVAEANYCHYRSAALQVAYVRLRDAGDPAQCEVIAEERELAKKLYALARHDSRLGFEATNHYAYTLNTLREKILNCSWLLSRGGAQ